MAAQINAAFKSMQDNLQVQTIKDALKVDTIIKDFDVLAPPEGSKTPGLLKNIAIGEFFLFTQDKLVLITTRSRRTVCHLRIGASWPSWSRTVRNHWYRYFCK
jgi:hypothetical protein